MSTLTVNVTLAVFFTEVLSHDAPARVVAALAWVITRHVVVYVTRCVLSTNLHLPTVHRPLSQHCRAQTHGAQTIVSTQSCTDTRKDNMAADARAMRRFMSH